MKVAVLLILGALIVAANSTKMEDLVRQEWDTYKLTYKLHFSTASDEQMRMKIYVDNRMKIAEHNAKFARGEVSFQEGVNRFTYLTQEEVDDIVQPALNNAKP